MTESASQTSFHNAVEILFYLGGVLVLILWLAFLSLELGVYQSAGYLLLFATLFSVALLIGKKKVDLLRLLDKKVYSRKGFWLIIFVLGMALFTGLFYHATVIPSLDSGVYSNCAIAFAKGNSLAVDEPIAFAGFLRASFNPRNVVCGQPPGHGVFLSLFYRLGGLSMMLSSNALLYFFTSLFVFVVGHLYAKWRGGLLSLLIFTSLYPSFYIPRRTLSENLMAFLVWLGSAAFLYGYQKRKNVFVLLSLLPILFLLVTRSEGVLYLATFTVAILFYFVSRRRGVSKTFLVGVGLSSLVIAFGLIKYILDFAPRNQFQILRALEGFLNRHLSMLAKVGAGSSIGAEPTGYVWRLLLIYSVVYLVGLVLLGIYKRIYNREVWLLLWLVAPSLIFLYKPSIALYHPWSLRRYWPVLFPLVAILSSYTLAYYYGQQRRLVITFVSLFIALNLLNSRGVLFLKANRGKQGVINTAQRLSDRISQDSLVITPDYYGSVVGRWCTFLHFEYDLNCLYPIRNHASNGVEYNSRQEIRNAFLQKYKPSAGVIIALEENPNGAFLPGKKPTIHERIQQLEEGALTGLLPSEYQFYGELYLEEDFVVKRELNYPAIDYQSSRTKVTLYEGKGIDKQLSVH